MRGDVGPAQGAGQAFAGEPDLAGVWTPQKLWPDRARGHCCGCIAPAAVHWSRQSDQGQRGSTRVYFRISRRRGARRLHAGFRVADGRRVALVIGNGAYRSEAKDRRPQTQKSPLLAGFCNFAPVSERPNWRTRRAFTEKSPAMTANIPVFGRFSGETRFDLHCVRGEAVDFAY